MSPRVAAVVVAAGSGTRVGAELNKVLLPLAGEPVLAHSVRTLLDLDAVHRLVVVVRPEDHELVAEALVGLLGSHDAWLVPGGERRHDSEWAAFSALAPDIEAGEIDVVAVHDGARPLATREIWEAVLAQAAQGRGALPVVDPGLLVHRDRPGTVPRLAGTQTPQAFPAADLLGAYRAAHAEGFAGTDTAACLARYSDLEIVGVPGEATNLKITFAEDVAVAELLVSDPRR